MKTIVVGIDFTESSRNAAHYAALLANKLDCSIVLLNLYDAPLIHSNGGMYFVSAAAIKKQNEDKLRRFFIRFKDSHPRVKMKYLSVSGSFRDEISDFLAHHRVQCVVMGLATKNRFSKFLYGSHSTDIAGKLNAPVIIVPEKYKEYKLKNVLLAVDNPKALSAFSLRPLALLAEEAGANIRVLHVRTENELLESPKKEKLKIKNKRYPVEVIEKGKIETGVNEFTGENKTDLICVLSHPHSVFYNMFNETNTKKIAFSTQVPVMAIHENVT